MITVNYKNIQKILNNIMKENKLKNKSQVLVRLSLQMEISFQRCWSLIEKQNIKNISQLNKLSAALGVPVSELIIIEEPKAEDYIPITQIF